MFKGRTSVLIIVGIVILAVLYLLLFRGGGRLTGPIKPSLPVDLQKIIPTSWKPIQIKACNFDDDEEEEWLITYAYDANASSNGLIGGVIYDAQVNRVPQAPGNESPYRPAFLVPYKLLPDFYTGKGQGYLGETRVEVRVFPAEQTGKPCQAQEITVLGYSAGDALTRLSIFRWGGEKVGYIGQHFAAGLRIEAGNFAAPVTQVSAYNRLNHRSALCEVRRYTRPAATDIKLLPPSLEFAEDAAAYTMDFCFGAPDDAAYPEGVVMALLRGNIPTGKDNNLSPTGKSYLTVNASLPAELARLLGSKLRVLSVTNEGTLAPFPNNGQVCDPPSLAPATPAAGTPTPTVWWCGRERATVVTEIILDGQHRIATWHLLSIANDRINADVHWRIESADLR